MQHLQKHWRRAVRSRRKGCTKPARSQSRGSGFAPTDPGTIRKCIFGYAYFTAQSTILLWKKVSTVFPASGAGKKPAPLPRGRKECSFSKGKRKGRSFCNVTKGTKNTEKGRGIPLPFSIPSPLTKEGVEDYSVCAGFAEAAG